MFRDKITNILTATVALLTGAIAIGAFIISYDALYATGLEHGIPESKAWLWPLLIDAPLIVFTLALLVAQILRAGVKLWAGLVLTYTVATIAFNLAHAQLSALGWLVAMVAPVSLLLTTEALRHLARGLIERQALVKSLAELTRQCHQVTTELSSLDKRRDSLTGQIEALTIQLDTLRADIARTNAETSPISGAFVLGDLDSLATANDAKRTQVEDRKRQALAMWSEGMSREDIAAALEVTPRTVKRYLNGHGGHNE